MSTIYPSSLAAKIAARNRCHELVKEWAPKLQAALAPFQGKKAMNACDVLPDKVKAALMVVLPPDLRSGPRERVYVSGRHGRIIAEFQTGAGWKALDWRGREREGWNQADASVTLGEIEETGDKLSKLPDLHLESYRSDFQPAVVEAARVKLDEAKKALRAAEGRVEICYFGEYDN